MIIWIVRALSTAFGKPQAPRLGLPDRHRCPRHQCRSTPALTPAPAAANRRQSGKNWRLIMTDLHGAAQSAHSDIVKMIIDAGADVNAKDSAGNTPLHLAGRYGYSDTVNVLIDAGANA